MTIGAKKNNDEKRGKEDPIMQKHV